MKSLNTKMYRLFGEKKNKANGKGKLRTANHKDDFLGCIIYSGRRLYQYNGDSFFIIVLIVNNLFSIYTFTSYHREAFLIDNFLLLLSLGISMTFNILDLNQNSNQLI